MSLLLVICNVRDKFGFEYSLINQSQRNLQTYVWVKVREIHTNMYSLLNQVAFSLRLKEYHMKLLKKPFVLELRSYLQQLSLL